MEAKRHVRCEAPRARREKKKFPRKRKTPGRPCAPERRKTPDHHESARGKMKQTNVQNHLTLKLARNVSREGPQELVNNLGPERCKKVNSAEQRSHLKKKCSARKERKRFKFRNDYAVGTASRANGTRAHRLHRGELSANTSRKREVIRASKNKSRRLKASRANESLLFGRLETWRELRASTEKRGISPRGDLENKTREVRR